ncbi:hypothetical protein VTK73DRAFT_1975 [Phialemonium thermophilum]|uniref:Uncharacterized protein n=1 Tax=Phialemonium thermophilum TaxID=223376 RepID=A0ABR3X6N4_9PEZI
MEPSYGPSSSRHSSSSSGPTAAAMPRSPPAEGPSWYGYIRTTMDALVIFEACIRKITRTIDRRPHEKEREHLITSGSVLVYSEDTSSIKRWTDGLSWSPSRILGNFLIYRELKCAFPAGEKKKAAKKTQNDPLKEYFGVSQDGSPEAMEAEKQYKELVGSLVDSYPFKKGGLVKKTLSINYEGVPYHLVSYYSIEDVLSGRLKEPRYSSQLQEVRVRPTLFMNQNFRVPLGEERIPLDDAESGTQQAQQPIPLISGAPGQFVPDMNAVPRSMTGPGPFLPQPSYHLDPHQRLELRSAEVVVSDRIYERFADGIGAGPSSQQTSYAIGDVPSYASEYPMDHDLSLMGLPGAWDGSIQIPSSMHSSAYSAFDSLHGPATAAPANLSSMPTTHFDESAPSYIATGGPGILPQDGLDHSAMIGGSGMRQTIEEADSSTDMGYISELDFGRHDYQGFFAEGPGFGEEEPNLQSHQQSQSYLYSQAESSLPMDEGRCERRQDVPGC